MNILIYSDLHIEFNKFVFPDYLDADVVVLAGDIHVGIKGIEWIRENLPQIPVIYVLGNHEYYGNAYPDLLDEVRAAASGTNIHFLENESVKIDGVVFHGATLWTDFNLFGDPELSGRVSKSRINDFGLISFSPEEAKIRPSNMIQIHKDSLSWLKRSLTENIGRKNIVVTHHAPSLISIDDLYKKDHTSAVFASHLERFIENYEPDLWIHGHIHHACDYTIGKTRIICEPRGYKGESNFINYSGSFIEI